MNSILTLLFAAIFASEFLFGNTIGEGDVKLFQKNTLRSAKYSILLALTMTASSALLWVLREYVIVPFSLDFLKTVLYTVTVILCTYVILCIAGAIFSKLRGVFHTYGGILAVFMALATQLSLDAMNLTLIRNVLYALASAVLFCVLSVIFTQIKEKLASSDVPESFRGVPIMLIVGGIAVIVISVIMDIGVL